MADKLISAVIPTYNYGRLVPEAVASALAQTYPNVEVIVIDDGSTDDTAERLAPFMDRIRYVRQDNQGLSAARNAGIRAAGGEWVALLDSDDAWHPRKLEAQARYLERHPEVGLLATTLQPDIRDGWPEVDLSRPPAATPITLDELTFATRFAPSSALVRKECFDRAGLFDPALRSAEDRDMWIRIACHAGVARLELPLCWYRVHGSSMCTAAARMEENELRVLRKAFAEVPALRRRPLFRMKAFSYAHYHAVYRYSASRAWGTALARFLTSFALWPLPYPRREVDRHLARGWMLAGLLLRLLRLKSPEAPEARKLAPRLPTTPAPARVAARVS